MNYKHFLCLFLNIFILIQADSSIIFTSGPDVTVDVLQKRFQEHKPDIYVDLHDVIASKNHLDAWKRIIRENGMYKAIFLTLTAGLCFPLFSDSTAQKFLAALSLYMITPIAYNCTKLGFTKKDSNGTRHEKRKIAENYYQFIKRWWGKKAYNFFIQYGTDIYSPNKALITLLYKLKEKGYKIFLFSNGGYDTIQAIEQDPRFKSYFEGPCRLFSNEPIVGKNSNSINDTPQEEYLFAKPDPKAFDAALAKHRSFPDYVIFIDDSRNKLADYQNKKITEKYPDFTNFWACSILYNDQHHSDLEEALTSLGIL